MQPLAEFPLSARARIRGVLCDIDDTITTDGRLTAAAYAAMEKLQRAGMLVIPITGRPAGWCDHIARMWPADAVVGENGAFYFRYDHTAHAMQRHFVDDDAMRAANRDRLAVIKSRILAAVPGCAVAADQHYREADLAIDYCEDVPRLPMDTVDKIVALMQEAGLTAKSQLDPRQWLVRRLRQTQDDAHADGGNASPSDLDALRDEFVFVGDSPNDAPMFAHFPYAVGVANINAFADRLTASPAYVTQAASGCRILRIGGSACWLVDNRGIF